MVAVTLKDKVEERGEKEKEGNQGDVERKKTEGAGTSQVIQDHGLSQEKDDMIDFRMSHQSRGRSSRRKRRERSCLCPSSTYGLRIHHQEKP